MVTATNQSITLYAGDSRVLDFQITDAFGNPVVLTGYSARWYMAPLPTSGSVGSLIKKTTSAGITMTTRIVVIAGVPITFYDMQVSLIPTDSSLLTPSPFGAPYYHELQLTDGSGNITTASTGNFTLLAALIPPGG